MLVETVHNFTIAASLNETGNESVNVVMDGKQLEGVNAVCVKAGKNGFTNVSVEVAAAALLQVVAALYVGSQVTDSDRRKLKVLMIDAASRTESEDIKNFIESEDSEDFIYSLFASIYESNGKGKV